MIFSNDLTKRIAFILVLISLLLLPIVHAKSSRSCQETWKDITSFSRLQEEYVPLINLCGDEFREKLREIVSDNIYLNYRIARHIMFSELNNVDGVVCGVYSENCIETTSIPDGRIMNCEHSWPQSLGATGIAKSDLHHLFPSMMRINSTRGNYPFCEVEDVTWSGDSSFLGKSTSGTTCFEPSDDHKGDLARAMFYFAVRYGYTIDAEQERFFRKWNSLDPITESESFRNDRIEWYQKNRNPFVDHPRFILFINNF